MVGMALRECPGPAAQRIAPAPAWMPARTPGGETAFIVAVAVLARLPTMFPSVIDWDESAFALAARELLHGHLPYTTFFDNKPVGSTVLFALIFAALGQSVLAMRLLGSVAVAVTAGILHRLMRGVGAGRAASVLAALFYIAFSTRLDGSATMTEILLGPFSAAGVLALQRAPQLSTPGRRLGAMAAAGLLFGAAVWIKYVPAAPAGCVGLVCLIAYLRRGGVRMREIVLAGALYAAGLALPTLATVAAYAGAGRLAEFWYANFGYATHYVGRTPDHSIGGELVDVLFNLWPLMALVAGGAVAAVAARGRRVASGPLLLILAWLAGEAVAVSAPLQFYRHYFLMALPPLCLLAALALRRAVRWAARPERLGAALAVSALAVMAVPLLAHVVDASRMLGRPDTSREVAALARQAVASGRPIFVVNDQPVIYLLAHAPLPTVYAFPSHLLGAQRGLAPIDRLAELRRVLALRPGLLVRDMTPDWTDPAQTDPAGRALVEQALESGYQRVAAFPRPGGEIEVYAPRS